LRRVTAVTAAGRLRCEKGLFQDSVRAAAYAATERTGIKKGVLKMGNAKAKPLLGPPAAALTGLVGKYNSPSPWANIHPYTIYFYYAAPAASGSGFDVSTYMWCENAPILPGDLPRHIAHLTSNARSGGSYPPRIGGEMGDVPWARVSYLVAVQEGAAGFDAGDAVEIWRDDGSTNGHPNHCFFDGGDGVIPVAGQANIAALWTVNYMRNKSGKKIPKGKLHNFKFRFNPRRGRPLYPDSGGTNMGPPVPPPV
jgi:hypothetical protein